MSRKKAIREMHRAADALAENELDRAERGYRAALQHDPALEPAWFDLGLVYKFRHDWRNSPRLQSSRC